MRAFFKWPVKTGRLLTAEEENDIVTEGNAAAEVRAADRGGKVCFFLKVWRDRAGRLCSAGKDDCGGRAGTVCWEEREDVFLTVCSVWKADWRRRPR